ncbi:MAG TPA: hypothetical protein VG406_02695, partial [Isosphaeraceae bacterium]|nr:hypothetical protein [Isosphaeraceae bacterium]
RTSHVEEAGGVGVPHLPARHVTPNLTQRDRRRESILHQMDEVPESTVNIQMDQINGNLTIQNVIINDPNQK